MFMKISWGDRIKIGVMMVFFLLLYFLNESKLIFNGNLKKLIYYFKFVC